MKIESGKRLYVAVIGARGYVGKAICDSLKNDSVHEVVEVTRTNYKKMKEQKYDIIINSSTPSKRFWAKQNPKKDFEETGKAESHEKRTFATLRRSQMDAIGSFSQIIVKLTTFHLLLANYLFSRFGMEFTTFRPKAVTLTWSPEII